MGQLKRSQDKNGRDIAFHFLDLPSRDDYPDYYLQTAMPISLNMVEQRLEDGEYATMDHLEGDLKRMVQNAKEYNDTRSEVFQDAERIRKALSNFMPKHNPSYADPEYRALPTPIPQAMLDRLRESSISTNATNPVKIRIKSSRQSTAPSATPEAEEADEDLQDNMANLLEELSNQDNAVNFHKKPPKRDYPDYYKVIDRPTSIFDVTTMVQQGKIGDWNALAREVRLIWKNAKEYNEPGSAIYEMTEELEQWFEEQVQAAGADSPKAPPRLSLSQPKKTGLKLKIGGSTPTPNFVGGAVDNESLKRQREETSQALGRLNRRESKALNTPAPSTAPSMTRSLSSVEPNGDVNMTGVNGIGPGTPAGTMDSVRGSLPPQKQTTPAPHQTNGFRPPEMYRHAPVESDNPMERKYRDPDKGMFCVTQRLSKTDWVHRPQRYACGVGHLHHAPKFAW